MSLVFDKHRLVSALALPPTTLRQTRAIARRYNAETVLRIGLVNNMPDSALQATERQFKVLLKAAAGKRIVDLRYFSLSSVKRSLPGQSRIERYYSRIADLSRFRLDGLIVTGAEPNAPFLWQEPYWGELADLVDWANTNTRSTIWSCLAAHAAVLHLDGVERRPLSKKCSGVFDCSKVADDWMIQDLAFPLKVSHSRLNELKRSDLAARGYCVLTESPEAGVDVFVKRLSSHFIFFQGHPEYDSMSLSREYRRDVGRFLAGVRDSYPAIPSGYFDAETEHRLAVFQRRAHNHRKPTLMAEFPRIAVHENIMSGAPAKVMFTNWLRYLSEH